MSIFQEILGTRSLTVICYIAERAIPSMTPDEQALLNRIMNERELDEIYALCHDHLGHPEEAAHLRNWLATRGQRQLSELTADHLD